MIDVENHNNKNPCNVHCRGVEAVILLIEGMRSLFWLPCMMKYAGTKNKYEVVLCGLRAVIIKSGDAAFSGK